MKQTLEQLSGNQALDGMMRYGKSGTLWIKTFDWDYGGLLYIRITAMTNVHFKAIQA
jgi:hypothetical protein